MTQLRGLSGATPLSSRLDVSVKENSIAELNEDAVVEADGYVVEEPELAAEGPEHGARLEIQVSDAAYELKVHGEVANELRIAFKRLQHHW